MDNYKPKIKAYTLENTIVEKYQAMVNLDLANSRMKDFYDIHFLTETFSFEGLRLQQAIEKTFKQREIDIPAKVPVGLTEAFIDDETKVKQWDAFLRNISDVQVPKDLLKIVNRLKTFFWPIIKAFQRGGDFKSDWRKK